MQPFEAGHPTPDDVQAEHDLRQALYRFDCPTPHTLGEYQLDLLDAVQRTSVAAHATGCEACLEELQTLRAYIAAPAPVATSVVERVRRVVASLFSPSPGLAYSGLRGAALITTRVFEAGDVTVSVGPGQAPGTLIGLVVVNAALPDALTGREARLIASGGGTVSALLDDLGNFEFADIAAGMYVLELDLEDSLIVLEALQVD
jgi:hypothetical protein